VLHVHFYVLSAFDSSQSIRSTLLSADQHGGSSAYFKTRDPNENEHKNGYEQTQPAKELQYYDAKKTKESKYNNNTTPPNHTHL